MKCKRENSDFWKSLPENIISKAKEALEKGADKVVSDAKNLCPVKSGNLKDSIHKVAQNQGLKYKIEADAKAKRGKQEFYGKVVEFSPKINHPYIYPAIDSNKKNIIDNISDAVHQACEIKS